MANEEHVSILRQGVKAWNEWRGDSYRRLDLLNRPNLVAANLTNANLRGANLSNADLNGADLAGADLSGTDLRWAGLVKANLRKANFMEADLRAASLVEADAREASFFEAFLSQAYLCRADLRAADLCRTQLHYADLSGADLREAKLIEANLWDTNFSGAELSGANLEQAALVRTDVTDSNLDSCHVYGIAVWDLTGTPKSQRNLVITPSYALEPPITVDDLEVAQFIYLLLKHEKLRNVINAVTQRGVLILGRFGNGGLDVLQAIAQKLREERYLPIIFDFHRPEGRDYTETVKTLVGLSRFVIVDLSGPSVPKEIEATVPFFDIPFVPIVEAGEKPFSMVSDVFKYPWFLRPIVEFGNKEELIEMIPSRIVSPAEERYKERQAVLDQLFKT